MRKIIVMFLVNLRWAYFHISPSYIKFYMDAERKEAHFQHVRTGQIYCNFVWVDNNR